MVLFIIITIGWMCAILYFSSRQGMDTTADSRQVVLLVGHVFHADFDDWTQEEQEAYVARMNYPIRKAAHMTEYAILGMLLTAVAVTVCGRPRSWIWLIPWLAGTAYAATDEIHQLFVAGREGKYTDICIDSVGVMAGVLMLYVILSIIYSKGKGVKENEEMETN
jgi:VanZ family protein